MKKNEPKYPIGTYVIVSAKMRRSEFHYVSWVPRKLRTPQLGQIVGLTIRHDGEVKRPLNWEDSSSYFISTGTHTFWQVKFGLMNTPICVREDDMRLARIDEVKELPQLYNQSSWSDQEKKSLSEDSKYWPRDSEGRWVAGPAIHK